MKNKQLKYIKAEDKDDELLTSTAVNSKKYWGYPDEQMDLWKTDDLQVTKEYIKKNQVYKVYDQSNFIGFYGIFKKENDTWEIDHLWLTTDNIRKGYGTIIFKHILTELFKKDAKKAILIAEPNAKVFYDKMGGKVIGEFQSKISGRFLDLYEFSIEMKSSIST